MSTPKQKEKHAEVLAIDLGGTFVKMGLVGPQGDIRENKVFDTKAAEPYKLFEERLQGYLREYKDLTQAEARLLIAYCDKEIAKFLMKHGDSIRVKGLQ